MNPDQFEVLSRILMTRSGLSLTPDKIYLAEVRLNPVARKHGYADAKELVAALGGFVSEQILSDVTEAMTTNESFFFRDEVPFKNFQEVILPHLFKTRATKKSVRIWCAACSSGQEPYSLAMILDQLSSQYGDWRFDIVATDLSDDMVAKAKSGEYTDFEVNRGLPEKFRNSYFREQGTKWVISPALRSRIDFRKFNLLDDPTALGHFDVVFCRNVLIYFDPKTKAEVLSRIVKLMPDDGFLTLGAAETVIGISEAFQLSDVGRGLYRPNTEMKQAV